MELRLHWSHHAVLPAEPGSPGRARALARRALADHGVPELGAMVEIVVSELATNATVHARTPFDLAIAGNTTLLLVRVRDQSPDPPVPRGTGLLPGEDEPGGRGLLLVDHFAHAWGTEIDPVAAGKTVWASFLLPEGGVSRDRPETGG